MIGIIGAGISGLSAGYYLQKAGLDYALFEASDVPGGYIKTYRENGYVLEKGPNSLMADREILDLIKELGLESDLVVSNPVSKNRYIHKGGRYRKLPSGPLSLLFSNYFSISTRHLIFKEFFLKPGDINSSDSDSLETFFLRHFGREVVNYALDPFIGGIYAGDPKKLLVSETFPSLLQMEKQYGSILKGLVRSAGERKNSYNFQNGMQTLPESIAKNLKHLHLRSKVGKIERSGNTYELTIKQNGDVKKVLCNQLILANEASSAASLLDPLFPGTATALAAIEYAPMAAVHSIYKKEHVVKKLDGFGALNPRNEDMFISGTIWSSSVFSGRCKEDEVVFTSFVGGTQMRQNFFHDEVTMKAKVHSELKREFSILSEPVFQTCFKWEKAIPQYDEKIKQAREQLEKLEPMGIYAISNWFKGVSIIDCIKKGKSVAEKICNIEKD